MASANLELRRAEGDIAAAERNGRWVAALGPTDLPIKTSKSEIGLGSVDAVRLLETRRREGKDEWTVVDTGSVHFTDRRMVFSGAKNVTFKYADVETDRLIPVGWLLGVSSRQRPHVVAGPVEQLQVLRDAVLDGVAGTDPMKRWKTLWVDATARRDRSEAEHREAASHLAGLSRPKRPVSPAWAPAAVAALVAIGSIDAPVVDQAVAAGSAVTTTTLETRVLGTSITTVVETTVTTTALETVRVVDVVSGEMLTVRHQDGSTSRVILAGIALPDGSDPSHRQALARLVSGQDVVLESDPAGGAVYVFVGSVFVNAALIEAGVVEADSDGLARASELEAAQVMAQQSAVGIWAPVTTSSSATTSTSTTTTTAPTTTTTEEPQCHPSYEGACVPVGVEDVDCAGGSGNGPYYVGRVRVVGPDVYGLDRDGDGIGCE